MGKGVCFQEVGSGKGIGAFFATALHPHWRQGSYSSSFANLVAASEQEVDAKVKGNKVAKAQEVGKILAKKALDKKIKEVAFD